MRGRFTVASGFSPRQYVTGRTPGRLEVLGLPGFRMAYVIDPAGEALFEIDADFDEEAINYTFY